MARTHPTTNRAAPVRADHADDDTLCKWYRSKQQKLVDPINTDSHVVVTYGSIFSPTWRTWAKPATVSQQATGATSKAATSQNSCLRTAARASRPSHNFFKQQMVGCLAKNHHMTKRRPQLAATAQQRRATHRGKMMYEAGGIERSTSRLAVALLAAATNRTN